MWSGLKGLATSALRSMQLNYSIEMPLPLIWPTHSIDIDDRSNSSSSESSCNCVLRLLPIFVQPCPQKLEVFKTRVTSFMPNLANRENDETIEIHPRASCLRSSPGRIWKRNWSYLLQQECLTGDLTHLEKEEWWTWRWLSEQEGVYFTNHHLAQA